MKNETTLCGRCIHKYDGVPGVKLTEIGPRSKIVCKECGKRTWGARCIIETVKQKPNHR